MSNSMSDSEPDTEERRSPSPRYSEERRSPSPRYTSDSSEEENHRSPSPRYTGDSSEEENHRSEEEASQRKRRKKIGTDLISSLPDPLLHHILSFLAIDEAMRTSLLSKRWQFLWTCMPDLTFAQGYRVRVREFVAQVHRTLVLCNSVKLNKLSVEFFYDEYNDRFAADVDAWVRFATQRKVENLELHFNTQEIYDDTNYKLPQHLYRNTSLTNLRLSYVNVLPIGIVGWTSLKSLTLKSLALNGEGISKILSGSPVLEFLNMKEVEFIGHLNIYSTSLKELVIQTCNYQLLDEFELEVSAPNLQSLHVFWLLDGTKFRLLNVSSLVSAYIDFSTKSFKETNKLLQSIVHVQELELGNRCFEALSKLESRGLMLHFPSNLKVFKIDVYKAKDIIPCLSGLLRCTRNLETLFIKMNCSSGRQCPIEEEKHWESLGKNLGRWITLKTVKISGDCCFHRNCMLGFVQFLLKNARGLEKMIVSKGFSSSRNFIKVAEELLSFPRSSPKAVVLFSPTENEDLHN